jgi:hypothetical protein
VVVAHELPEGMPILQIFCRFVILILQGKKV